MLLNQLPRIQIGRHGADEVIRAYSFSSDHRTHNEYKLTSKKGQLLISKYELREKLLSIRKQIEAVQRWSLEANGSRIVYASDELYLLANLPLPDDEAYEGYPQYENGVGMLRALIEETREAIRQYLARNPDLGDMQQINVVHAGE